MKTFSLCLIAFLGFSAPHAFPQGPLTPPTGPAPIMKTLDQIQPRIPINATNTPGDGASVFKITTSGSYYLTGPLTGAAGKNGISVTASNVTIDLCGFALNGVGSSLDGIHMESGTSNLTLRNGVITGWGGDGVDEVDNSATDGIYEELRATGNNGDGLRLSDKCVVTSCKLDHNSGNGLSVDGRATIKNCTANDNGLDGFLFGAGSVLDSVASANGSSGIESNNEPNMMKNCVAFENSDAGIRSGGGGKIMDCFCRNNANEGIDTGYYTSVTNCEVKNNPWGIYVGGFCHIVGNMGEGNGDGIFVFDGQNLIDGNQMINSGTGIHVLASSSNNNIIIRNSVSHRPTDDPGSSFYYIIAAGNTYGPIIDRTAGGSPAVGGTGASAPDTTTTTHPWANFSF